ncbi:MAG: AgmX/PglI C-terminal domain-containing protein [Myxococcota bacterium]
MHAEDSESLETPMTTDQVLEYVLASSASASDALADRSRGRVLEVTQVWGDSVLQVRHFPRAHVVRLGAGDRDFAVAADELTAPEHPLFGHDGDGWVCTATSTWPAFLESAAGRVSFADLVACGRARRDAEGNVHVAFGDAERVVVHVGAVAFCAQAVYPSKRVAPGKKQRDHAALGMVGFMSFCAAMLGIAVAFVPSPPKATKMEISPHVVELFRKLEEEKKPVETAKAPAVKKVVQAPGKEGKANKSPDDGNKLAKQALDREAAATAGVLGAIAEDEALQAALGGTGLNSTIEAGIKDLIGVKTGCVGCPGFGQRGDGPGGGAKTASIGDVGPKARKGGEWGGDFTQGERGSNPVRFDGDPIILGSLDKALIDAVIKRNLAQIRYCYQRELTKNPGLSGKITEKFVIAADGSVSTATTKTSTMNSPAVETCINGRFMRFTFPQPKGGGIVVVSYPFVFAPG